MEVEVPTKPWYESATIWVNILGTLLMVVGIVIDSALDLNIPPQALAVIVTIQSILTILLRAFRTNLPIGPEGGTRTVTVKQPTDQP